MSHAKVYHIVNLNQVFEELFNPIFFSTKRAPLTLIN